MMWRKFILLALAITAIFGACKPDDEDMPCPSPDPTTGKVHLELVVHWNGDTLDINDEFTHPLGWRLRFSDIRVYLGDINLTNSSTIESVDRVAYFGLFDFPTEIRSHEYNVAPGLYDNIEFGIGVPADLNAIDPGNQAPEYQNDLTAGTHWGMINYRFAMVDGFFDSTGVAGTPIATTMSYHSGKDAYYRDLSINLNVPVALDSTTNLYVDWDLSKTFYSATDTIMVPRERFLHGGPSSDPLNEKFSDNTQQAFTVHL